MKNGKLAIKKLIREAEKSSDSEGLVVKNAMYRTGIGNIDFVWGKEGVGPKFKKGYGLSHIIAKRNAETGNGQEIANKMVEVIAKATEIEVQSNENIPNNDRIKLFFENYTAILSQSSEGNTWLLTGWENKKETITSANGEGYDSAEATTVTPTHTQRNGDVIVSDNSISENGENVNVFSSGAGVKNSLSVGQNGSIINTGSDDNGLRNQGTVYGGSQERQATDAGTKRESKRTFKEDEGDYLRRTSGNAQETGRGRWVHVKYKGRDLAYVQKGSDTSSQSRAVEALNDIGVKAIFCDGPMFSHKDGITTEHYEAMAAPDGTVYVSSGASLSSIEIAFHEAVHSHDFRSTQEYAEYESIVCENIDYLSETYLEVAEKINQNYYAGKYDIYDIENAQKFIREITAYINQFVATDPQYAEQLFGGMFEDWGAVVNASKTFSESIGLKSDNELFEALNSDSGAGQVLVEPSVEKTLNQRQAELKELGEKTGRKIVFEDTKSKRGFKSDGYYDRNDGSIHIDYECEAPESEVLKHELVHFGETSPLFSAYKKAVADSKAFRKWLDKVLPGDMDFILKKVKFREIIRDNYANSGQKLSVMEADTEMICMFTAKVMFKDGKNGVNRLVNDINAKQRNSFVRFIKSFLTYIKQKFSGNTGITREIIKLENSFVDVLKTAKTDFSTHITKNTAKEGDVAYSISNIGFDEFSKETQNNIKMRGDIIVDTIDDLEKNIEIALQKQNKANLHIGAISENVKKKIENSLGEKIFKDKQYTFVVSYDDIIHISEHFGKEIKSISREILKLYDIIKNYDTVKLEITSKGTKKLIFEKSYSDYDYRTVEIASNKKSTLDLVTLYITKNNIKNKRNQSNPPVITNGLQPGSVSSINNIQQNDDIVNNNISKNDMSYSIPTEVKDLLSQYDSGEISREEFLFLFYV